MTPLYRNRSIWTRGLAYALIAVAALAWGSVDLWRGLHSEGSEAGTDAMFGVLFIGGGLYAIWQTAMEWRNVVIALDRDASGGVVARVWGPVGPRRVTGEFRDWRFHVAIAGRMELPYIYVDNAAWPRPLRFDLRQKADLAGLRTVAPEAMAEYEARFPRKV